MDFVLDRIKCFIITTSMQSQNQRMFSEYYLFQKRSVLWKLQWVFIVIIHRLELQKLFWDFKERCEYFYPKFKKNLNIMINIYQNNIYKNNSVWTPTLRISNLSLLTVKSWQTTARGLLIISSILWFSFHNTKIHFPPS